MDLEAAVRTLWKRRIAVVGVVLAAVVVGVATRYDVSLSPPGLPDKSVTVGSASTQMLFDAPRSQIADWTGDVTPLAVRAQVYARLVKAEPIRDVIAAASNLRPEDIVIQNADEVGSEPPAAQRADEIIAEGSTYRLLLQSAQDLPVVTIYAQAPDARSAERLANGAVRGFTEYVTATQERLETPERRRLTVTQLGTARGATIATSSEQTLAVLAFFATLLAGTLLVLLVDRLVSAARGVRPEPKPEEAPHAMTVIPGIADPSVFVSDDGDDVWDDPGRGPQASDERAERTGVGSARHD
jgi:hypothetical protein